MLDNVAANFLKFDFNNCAHRDRAGIHRLTESRFHQQAENLEKFGALKDLTEWMFQLMMHQLIEADHHRRIDRDQAHLVPHIDPMCRVELMFIKSRIDHFMEDGNFHLHHVKDSIRCSKDLDLPYVSWISQENG